MIFSAIATEAVLDTLVTSGEISDITGPEIRGCQGPRAPFNSPAAPANLCRELKIELLSIHSTFR